MSSPPTDAEQFEACIRGGGVVVFPSDTVYGLACDPLSEDAVHRLYALKQRPPEKASAVMFFDLDTALAELDELEERTRSALSRMLPGGVTVLLPNPRRRYPLACRADPSTLGLRVPVVPALSGVSVPVLQSSANPAGGADSCRLDEVPAAIREGADLVIDGGDLPGVSSTVVDLRRYAHEHVWSVVRLGAVAIEELTPALEWQFHFDPASYAEMIRQDIPIFDRFQDELVQLTGQGAERILELGTGTGETADRLLARHPEATLVGVDQSSGMLDAARRRLPDGRVELRASRLQEELPPGPFDLIVSALTIHHLDAAEKQELFLRLRGLLRPGGRLVIGDVVVSVDLSSVRVSLTPGYDKPSTVHDQLMWLATAGFTAHAAWESGDLVVIVADVRG